MTRRTVVSIGLLLLAMLGAAGFAAYTASELGTARLELQAREAELEILKRRPLVVPGGSGETVTGDPFLEGGTLALAANALQQRLVGLVETTGGTLRSVAVEPPNEAPEGAVARRAVVQASANMTIGALQTLLYRLETETPFAFVEGLTVQRVEGPRLEEAAAAGPGATEADQLLNVELRVSGYWRGAVS